jgi:Zn-dependent membrane protease YugP
MRRAGTSDVRIEPVQGTLADHYDPRGKVLRLSPEVYESASLAALGVAAHETGHAIQHRDGYAPLALRSAIVPLASFGTQAAIILFMIGILASMPALMDLGILLFLGYVIFSLITLPVEFNASSRAVQLLQAHGFVMPQEAQGVRAVLNAAAMTYVAAAAMAVLQLLRLVILRNRRD